jgi:hypothetical protein
MRAATRSRCNRDERRQCRHENPHDPGTIFSKPGWNVNRPIGLFSGPRCLHVARARIPGRLLGLPDAPVPCCASVPSHGSCDRGSGDGHTPVAHRATST